LIDVLVLGFRDIQYGTHLNTLSQGGAIGGTSSGITGINFVVLASGMNAGSTLPIHGNSLETGPFLDDPPKLRSSRIRTFRQNSHPQPGSSHAPVEVHGNQNCIDSESGP
jgi:hypothetical protein